MTAAPLAAATALILAGCSAAASTGSSGPPEPTVSSVSVAAQADSSGRSSAAAGSAAADGVDHVTPRTMPDGKGSGLPDGQFPRTVKHFAGETVVTAEPQRVVVVSTGQADALLTLGVVPVGSTSGDGADMIPPYLSDAFPADKAALDAVTPVGTRLAPDLETIATTKPDLILMNSAGKDAQALYESLSAVAPTVVTQGTGLYWKQDFLLLADALGRTEQAQRWLDEYHADAAAFGDSLADPPTVSLLRKNGDRIRIFGVASFAGSVAEDAALPRPESQQFTDETSQEISTEQLGQADGDWIFYGVQGGDETELTAAPLWPTLPAVAAGQAVEVDDDAFYLNTGPTAARDVLATLQTSLAR